MAIAIVVGRDLADKKRHEWFIDSWKKALLSLDPSLDIRVWPDDVDNVADIEVALVWRHSVGVLNQFPVLKAVISLAAGVDHVFVDQSLNQAVPVARVVDSYMATDIMQYVVASVLGYMKRFDHWSQKQAEKVWSKEPPFTLVNEPVGVMGLGFLGGRAAIALADVGLKVKAWRQTDVAFDKRIECYVGDNQLHAFLSDLRVLVCMLPLTPRTQGILSQSLFAQLPKGAYLINVGRGEELVDDDLLQALQNGQLSGATLDVFHEEPLPLSHAFWDHPKVHVTPHIASVTNPMTAAPQVLENYRRALAGQELTNRVSLVNLY